MALAFGVWIGLQAIVNIGVNMGVLPTKGLTLPLLSYGRSSLLVTLIWIGVLLAHLSRGQVHLALGGHAQRGGHTMTGAPVLIMAGGTGGHVFPALAVADALRERGVPVVWLGVPGSMESRLVPAHGIPIEWVRVAGIRGKGASTWLLAPLRIARAVMQAGAVLRRIRPRAVLGAGGFVSGPGGIAAWLLRIPLLIHEQNAVAGMTNRWLARIAAQVLEAFPDSFGPRVRARCIGNPVRADIAALPAPALRFRGRSGASRVLVLGGSQGAQRLNALVPQALARMSAALRPHVRHQTGARGFDAARAAYGEAAVEAELVPFIDDMAAAYGWADLAICRAGALTITELQAAGLGALLVPFPSAVDDHQTKNAAIMVRRGAARIVQERDLSAEVLAGLIGELTADRTHALAMAEAARGAAVTDAAASSGRTAALPPEEPHERPHAPHSMHPLRRHRRQRHGRHRRGAAEPGLRRAGLGSQGERRDAAARAPRARRSSSATPRTSIGDADVVVVSTAVNRAQSGGRRGARGAHPGRAARRNARRAHALPLLDRGRRHARQDHHDQPGRERARRGGTRSRPS